MRAPVALFFMPQRFGVPALLQDPSPGPPWPLIDLLFRSGQARTASVPWPFPGRPSRRDTQPRPSAEQAGWFDFRKGALMPFNFTRACLVRSTFWFKSAIALPRRLRYRPGPPGLRASRDDLGTQQGRHSRGGARPRLARTEERVGNGSPRCSEAGAAPSVPLAARRRRGRRRRGRHPYPGIGDRHPIAVQVVAAAGVADFPLD